MTIAGHFVLYSMFCWGTGQIMLKPQQKQLFWWKWAKLCWNSSKTSPPGSKNSCPGSKFSKTREIDKYRGIYDKKSQKTRYIPGPHPTNPKILVASAILNLLGAPASGGGKIQPTEDILSSQTLWRSKKWPRRVKNSICQYLPLDPLNCVNFDTKSHKNEQNYRNPQRSCFSAYFHEIQPLHAQKVML